MNTDCLIRMVRETGAHLVSCITLVVLLLISLTRGEDTQCSRSILMHSDPKTVAGRAAGNIVDPP